MAASTRSRTASRTFGSLLSTRDTVFFEVPEARATSSMVARVMKVWPDSMRGSLVGACRVLDGDGDAPGHSVTSLSLHRTGSTGWSSVGCLIERCWNSATPLDLAGRLSVTVAMSRAPSRRTLARTSLAAPGRDCSAVKSAYCVSGVRYQFECGQSSRSAWVESQ